MFSNSFEGDQIGYMLLVTAAITLIRHCFGLLKVNRSMGMGALRRTT